MKRSIIAALAALLLTTSAQAGTTKSDGINETVLYESKKAPFWKVAHYSYDNQTAEQCALGTSWTERKTIISGWYLKFNMDHGLHWAFAKTSWRMTEGNNVASILSVDGRTWSGKAMVQKQRNEIAAPFADDAATEFLGALRTAKQLSIVFPTAPNETPFIVTVDQKALAKFSECSSQILADSGPAEEAPEQQEQKPTSETPLGGPKFRGA